MSEAEKLTDEAKEEAQPTLDDDIAAAMAEVEGEPEVKDGYETLDVSEEANTEEDKPEETADTEESEEEEVSEETDDAEETDEPGETPPELLKPHEHWKNEYKQGFSTMTREQQDLWLQREKEYEHDKQARSAELNQVRDSLADVHQMVSPYVEAWQRRGVTPSGGLMRALALAESIDKDPAAALQQLAAENSVDLGQVAAEAPYVDPQVKQLQDELKELREKQAEAERSTLNQQQEQATMALREFEEAADADGNLKHPHFRKVFHPMGVYLQSGKASTLEQAYDMAVRFDPDIQAELQAEQKVSKVETRQNKAERAKAASKVVESGKTATSDSAKTLDEMLDEQLTAAGYTN